jgi:hypothetical protein
VWLVAGGCAALLVCWGVSEDFWREHHKNSKQTEESQLAEGSFHSSKRKGNSVAGTHLRPFCPKCRYQMCPP